MGKGVDVDLTEYKEIIKSPQFTRLRYVQQVPFAESLYLGCTHKREEHCVGTYYLTKQILNRLGRIFSDEKESILVAALIHDIGHPPFSHVVENILKKYYKNYGNHDKQTVKIAESLEKKISKVANYDTVIKILKGSYFSEFSPIIDSILGADKLDYISRDLHHCGIGSGEVEKLLTYVISDREEKKYGVQYEFAGNTVIDFLKMWWSAHREIYLNRDVEIPRTMFQRALLYSIKDDEIKLNSLPRMDDVTLMSKLRNSENKKTKYLMDKLDKDEFYIPFMTIKLKEYEKYAFSDVEFITGLDEKERNTLYNLDDIMKKEKEISEMLKLPEGRIIITRSEDIERLDPKKKLSKAYVYFKNNKYFKNKSHFQSIKDIYPDFSNFLSEEVKRHYNINIAVDSKHYDKIKSNHYKEIFKTIKENTQLSLF